MSNIETVLKLIAKAKSKGSKVLDLSQNYVEKLPPELFTLTELTHLNLNQNRLTRIPSKIAKLTKLVSLDLSDNDLKILPTALGKLSGLTHLNLKNTSMKKLSGIGKLVNLTNLNLNSIDVIELPSEMVKLKKLTTLSLYAYSLTSFPKIILKLPNLVNLYLDESKSLSLTGIGEMKNLTELSLVQCALEKLPEELESLTKLNTLNLHRNDFKQFPIGLLQLKSLRNLNLGRNLIKKIPSGIAELTKLKSINLEMNKLKELPAEITFLKDLTSLNIGSNKLQEFPISITNLIKLKALGIDDNKLTELPTSIGKLIKLETLEVNDNKLTELPTSIGKLVNLKTLNLDSNDIEELPVSFDKLVELKVLDISNNKLTELPTSIAKFSKLKDLDVTGNKLTEIPIQISAISGIKISSDKFKKKKTTEPFNGDGYEKTFNVILQSYKEILLNNLSDAMGEETWSTPNTLSRLGIGCDQSTYYINPEFGDADIANNKRHVGIVMDLLKSELFEVMQERTDELISKGSDAPDNLEIEEEDWTGIEFFIRESLIIPILLALVAKNLKTILVKSSIKLAKNFEIYVFNSAQTFWLEAKIPNSVQVIKRDYDISSNAPQKVFSAAVEAWYAGSNKGLICKKIKKALLENESHKGKSFVK